MVETASTEERSRTRRGDRIVTGVGHRFLVASRDHATSDDLSAYIATNALRITDRSPVETVKVLLHGPDYAAQTIRHLLGMCACVSAERDGDHPQDVGLFAELRQGIWDGTRGFDRTHQSRQANVPEEIEPGRR